MNFPFLPPVIVRAPEDGAEGGEAAVALETHEADAKELFGHSPPPIEPPAGKEPAAPPAPAKESPIKAPPATPANILDVVDEPKTAPTLPAATPPAAPEEAPEDKITLTEKSAPTTHTQFEQLKAITKAERAEKSRLAAELVELRTRGAALPDTSPEADRLRAENKTFGDRLAILDLQNHPQFQKQFVEPRNQLLANVSEVLAANEIKDVDVNSLIAKSRPDFAKAVSAIAEQLPVYEQQAFIADMRQVQALDTQAKAQLANAGKLAQNLAAQSVERQRTTFEATWKALDFSAEKLKPFPIAPDASPEEKTALEAYNKGLTEIRGTAEKLAFGRMDEAGTALVASEAATFRFLRGHVIPKMAAEYQKSRDLIAELTAEITALKGSRQAGTGTPSGDPAGDEAEETHEQAARKLFSR